MKKLILIGLCMLWITVKAQDFPYDQNSPDQISMKIYEKDTSANAVVLSEFGNARISSVEGLPIEFIHHVKIKILNSNGFDHGNIVIPLIHSDNNTFETIRKIEGITSYVDESGKLKKVKLDQDKILKERTNKYRELIKFAMPDLRAGCIIEYQYIIESPYRYKFRKWEFQSSIPKIYSEYIAHIPGIYNYNASLQGYLKLFKTESEIERECFSPGGSWKADCSKMTYIMKDIPAFVEEANMTSPVNFISAINYELTDYSDYYGKKYVISKDWKDIDETLKKDENFGVQLKKKDFFTNKLPLMIGSSTDELSKAKAIYSYLQHWFKWDNFYGIYSDGIRKAFEKQIGSTADINLNLVTALNSAGLNTEAVILSTRDNGNINKLYPTLGNFNYVVAKVNIEDKSYLLDASDPQLPFGLLPLHCINDQGRVMSLNKPSYWIDMIASEKESSIYNLILTLQENGKLKGSVTTFSMGYEAYNKRVKINEFNTVDEYYEDRDEQLTKIKILKTDSVNLDSLNQPLAERYDIEIDAFDNLNKEKFYFNPFFVHKLNENPFKLIERSYPVDMGASSDSRTTITITIPDKFEIISKPDDTSISLPNNGGKYFCKTEINGNQFIFSELLQLNKAIYQPEEYPYLKELYNRMIQLQKSDIVFKKKN